MDSFDFAAFVTLATAKPCPACKKANVLTIYDFNNSAQGKAATATIVSEQAKQFAGMLTNQRKGAFCACCWNRVWEAELARRAAKALEAAEAVAVAEAPVAQPAKVRKPRVKKVVAAPAF